MDYFFRIDDVCERIFVSIGWLGIINVDKSLGNIWMFFYWLKVRILIGYFFWKNMFFLLEIIRMIVLDKCLVCWIKKEGFSIRFNLVIVIILLEVNFFIIIGEIDVNLGFRVRNIFKFVSGCFVLFLIESNWIIGIWFCCME